MMIGDSNLNLMTRSMMDRGDQRSAAVRSGLSSVYQPSPVLSWRSLDCQRSISPRSIRKVGLRKSAKMEIIEIKIYF